MTEKQFATEYNRDSNGWIIFPGDSKDRERLFTPESMGHIARANLYMVRSIVDYVSQPDEVIMDITAGSGTILIAATMDRNVLCIEIEKPYVALIENNIKKLDALYPDKHIVSRANVLLGSCTDFLPIPCQHIIFSPPYADALKRSSVKADSVKHLAGSTYRDTFTQYSMTQGNLGLMDVFLYNQTMENIYQKCWDSLLPGGTLTVIIKDRLEKGKRIYLSDWMLRTCVRLGFSQRDWFKRYSPGTGFNRLWEAKGMEVIKDEDIIIMGKDI